MWNLQLVFLVSIRWKIYKMAKKNALCGTIKTLLENGKEITTPSEISLTLKKNYEDLFQKILLSLSGISKCF